MNMTSAEPTDIIKKERREKKMLSSFNIIKQLQTKFKALSLIKSLKRVSFFPSFYLKGSMALEGSLVLPLLLLFVMTLLFGLEIIRFQSCVFEAMHQSGSRICFSAYGEEYGKADNNIICNSAAESAIRQYLGMQYLPYLCVNGGKDGVSIQEDRNSVRKGNLEIRVSYDIKTFIWWLPIGSITINDKFFGHGFIGYTGDMNSEEEKKPDIYVYITPSGSKYHVSEECTYLKVKIHAVPGEELEEKRNGSGGKYYACEWCKPQRGGLVYLTDWGNRYHGETDCPALKRTVYIVPLSEAGQRTACRKCG